MGQAVTLYDFKNDVVEEQNPMPVSSDSVYPGDIWVDESETSNWVDIDSTELDPAVIPFSGLHTRIQNSTSDSPKELLIHFKRTVVSNGFGLGCAGGGNFSNVEVIIINSGDTETSVYDDSGNDTKYTTKTINFPVTPGFNGIKILFHTADTVTLSNIVILKSTSTLTRLQATKPDNTVTDINATTGGNLKISLEEFEEGISTNNNSQLKTTLYGEDGTDLYVEELTHGMPNINTDHALIHSGYGFSFSMLINPLAGSATQEYCLTSPLTRYIHLKDVNISVLGSSISVEIIKDPTVTVNTGTTVSIDNLNQNSSYTADTTIKESPTYTGGTTVRAIYALADSTNQAVGNANFNQNPNQEFVTKNNNTQYILKVTNLTSNDCIVAIDAFMYEEHMGITT